MPKFLEEKLKKEYGANSAAPYKIMNSMGVMHGNRVTPKGAAMDEKHHRDIMMKEQARRVLAKKK